MLNNDDKVTLLVQKLEDLMCRQHDHRELVDSIRSRVEWQTQVIGDLRQRHEEFADDCFGAVQEVEKQVWNGQDLVAALIERIPQPVMVVEPQKDRDFEKAGSFARGKSKRALKAKHPEESYENFAALL